MPEDLAKGREETPEPDERGIHHNPVDGFGEARPCQMPSVFPLPIDHSRIGQERRGQLAVAHVDGVDPTRAVLQQTVREASRGRSDIRADCIGWAQCERIERAAELVTTSRNEPVGLSHLQSHVFAEEGSRLVHSTLPDEYSSAQQECLGLTARFAQTPFHQHQIDSLFHREASIVLASPRGEVDQVLISPPKKGHPEWAVGEVTMRIVALTPLVVGLVLGAHPSMAQPVEGGTLDGQSAGGTTAPPPAVPAPPPAAPAPVEPTMLPPAEPAPPPAAAPAPSVEVGMGLPAQATAPLPADSDHDRVVGHLGVGYLGYQDVSFGAIPVNERVAETTSAPVVGVRYWFAPRMGIDVGVGLAVVAGSNSTEVEGVAGSNDVDTGVPTAFVLHAGLPISVAAANHYSFQIVPECNIAFASAEGPNDDGDTVERSGFQLAAGARAGAEIHFGFMDLPQLALQGSVGALLSYTRGRTKVSPEAGDAITETSTRTVLETTLHDSPWNIFVTNVAALYYF